MKEEWRTIQEETLGHPRDQADGHYNGLEGRIIYADEETTANIMLSNRRIPVALRTPLTYRQEGTKYRWWYTLDMKEKYPRYQIKAYKDGKTP